MKEFMEHEQGKNRREQPGEGQAGRPGVQPGSGPVNPPDVQLNDADSQSGPADAEGIRDRRRHLLYRPGDSELRGEYRAGKGRGRRLVLCGAGAGKRDFDRSQYFPADCEMGRRGSAGADHRLCEQRGCGGYRVSEGRAGLWDRLQDLYDCGAGDPVWNLYKLGSGADLLDSGTGRGLLKADQKEKDCIFPYSALN